jgi:hypothetical protein
VNKRQGLLASRKSVLAVDAGDFSQLFPLGVAFRGRRDAAEKKSSDWALVMASSQLETDATHWIP